MEEKAKMVSAIILNYLNPELTAKAVDHLAEASLQANISTEVIVVDNSAPKTAEKLKELLPKEVKIIENEENRGFSAANNQGIKIAAGEVILIMNNDLFMNDRVLKAGVKAVVENKKTGVWAPKLLYQSGKPQRSCSEFPTLKSRIAEYLFKYTLQNRIAVAANKESQPVNVDRVMGACMFIRKTVLVEAELFDEDYFFYVEDTDLCYKIKSLGYDVLFDPRCQAVHIYSASQSHQWYDDPYLHEARKLYHKKHFSPIKAVLANKVIDIGIFARKWKHKND